MILCLMNKAIIKDSILISLLNRNIIQASTSNGVTKL
jgi:hypothetical protein